MTGPEASAAASFAALGDPVRLMLLTRLAKDGPLPTKQLLTGVEMSRQAVAKHLQVLEDVHLIGSDKQGGNRLWHVRQGELARLQEQLARVSQAWDSRLERLRKLVELQDD